MFKVVAIHKPTGEHYEMGTFGTLDDALYAIKCDVEFDPEDVPQEWAFQVVDKDNDVVAYGESVDSMEV